MAKSNFFKHGLNISNEWLKNVNKHLEIEHNRSVADMFERIGKGRTYAPTERYNPQEHRISGFANKNDALLFSQHMAGEGRKVVVAPVKINGQYLVDVRVNENEQKKYESEVEKFSEKNNIVPERQKPLKTDGEDTNYNNSGSSIVSDTENLFKQDLGNSAETQKMIHIISTIERISNEYNRNTDNNSAFHNVNGSGNIAESNVYRKATIVGEQGDYTIIIDGRQIDNDSHEGKRIIKQHEKRLNIAQTAIDTAKESKRTTAISAIGDSLKGTSKHGFVRSFKEMKENSNSILENSMKQEYYSKEIKGKSNVFNGGVLDRFIEQANTLHVIERKRSPKEVILADGSKKNLDFTKNERLILNKLAKAGGAGSTLFSRATALGTVTDYQNRIELTNALAEMKGKGIVSDDEIQTLMNKVKLEPSEQVMFMPKQNGEIGYSFGKDGRSTNTLSKMEKDLDLKKYGISLSGNVTRDTMLQVNDAFFAKVSEYNESIAKYNKGVKDGTIKGELKEPLMLFKSNGQFDKEALLNNYKKLDISKETAEIIGSFNEKGAFGNLSKSTKNELVNKGLYKLSGTVEDQEVQQYISQARMVTNYGTKMASTVKQAHQIAKTDVETSRIKHAKVKDTNKPVTPKTKEKTNPEKVQKKSEKAEKKAEKHTKKLKKKAKRMEKFENSALGKAVNLKKKLEQEIAKIFSPLNAVKAYVMHIVGVGAMVLVTALGGLTVALIVLIGIENFLAVPDKIIMGLKAPKTYEDTCMYILYEKTKMTEDGELGMLNDFQGFFDNRQGFKFGDNQTDYEDYIANIDYLYDDGTTLYINPFNVAYDDEENKKYMKALTYINGAKDITFKTNANPIADVSDTDERFVSTESGHTSNIKDILCMVDVMYQYDSTKFSDTQLESVLGMSPEQVDYVELKDSFLGSCKTVVKNIVTGGEKAINWIATHIFGQENVEEIEEEPYTNRYAESEDGIVSWEGIQNYVEKLFQASHQESYNMDVNFYEVTEAVDLVDDYSKEFYEGNACVHGYCVFPEKNDFKIATTHGTATDGTPLTFLSPYIKTKDGIVKYLWAKKDETANDAVTIDMSDYVGDNADLCFPTPEGEAKLGDRTYPTLQADEGGYLWVKTHSNDSDYNSGDNANPPCWKMVEEKVNEGEDEYLKKVVSAESGWFDSPEKAREDLENKLKQQYDSHSLQGDTYNYNSSTSYDKFTRNYSVKPEFSVNVTDTPNKPYNEAIGRNAEGWVDNGNISTYVIRGGNTWWTDHYANCLGLEVKLAGNDGNYSYNYWNNGTYEHWGVKNAESKVNFDGGYYRIGDYVWFNPDDSGNSNWKINELMDNGYLWNGCGAGGYLYIYVHSGDWKTMYQAKGNAVVEERHREIFTRECEGHPFRYCGGHLDANASCNVYSSTNEQMSLAGAYAENEEMPQASDFMTEERKKAYKSIEGKTITKNVNFDTIANATTTGMGLGLTDSPMGSLIGSQYGLNLYVDGSQWGKGIKFPESRKSNLKFARDIFDIDWLITKGYNIFPLSNKTSGVENVADETINKGWKNYEGWNSDNMTIACLKQTADWNDLYEFDIPTEVDSFSVSKKDRKKFLEAIKRDYGEGISEDRLKMVETALTWVGRGHYSEEPEHLKHNFLSSTCTVNEPPIEITDGDGNVINSSIDFSASCTATDSKGFAVFCLKESGISPENVEALKSEIATRIEVEDNEYLYRTYGVDGFKPADIIVHKAKEWKHDNISDTDLQKFGSEYAYDIYSIYIGTFSEEITIGGVNNEVKIPANVPVIVDIFKGVDTLNTESKKTNYGFSCGIKLRFGVNSDQFFNDDHNCWCWLSNGKAIYKLDYDDLRNTLNH